MTKADYCNDLDPNSIDCKNRVTITFSPTTLFKLGENQNVIFKCKYAGLVASINIRFAKFPQMPLPSIVFSGKPGTRMELKLDFGDEYYDQVRIFIFRIPKGGYTDPNTGTLIKPGKDIHTAINEANSQDRDFRKIYRRRRSQSKELKAFGRKFKIKILKQNSKTGIYKEKVFIKNKRSWRNDEYQMLIKVRASRAQGSIYSRAVVTVCPYKGCKSTVTPKPVPKPNTQPTVDVFKENRIAREALETQILTMESLINDNGGV